MDAGRLIDLGQQALLLALLLSAPLVLLSLLTGVLSGFVQAITQIQDPVITFAPKLLVAVIALSCLLPWLMSQLGQYTTEIFSHPWPGR